MEKNYIDKYKAVEENHPWFKARRKLFRSIIPNDKELRILDFGCGSGQFLISLCNEGYKNLFGIEPNISKKVISINNVDISINKKLDKNNKYDVVLMMDVLEHIEDDLGIILKIVSQLNNGGMLLISVPAYNLLWSEHDTKNMHFRRYNRKTLSYILKQTDLNIKWISNWNFFMFPLIAINRLCRNKFKQEIEIPHEIISFILYKLLCLENILLKKIGLPFGVSIIACAEKN